MLGLRFYFNERHKREWMTDGSLDWLWPAAGVPVALAAALFLPTVGQIAERHPGLKLIVDHMAVPPGGCGESAYRFQPELLALAKYPNVGVKATGQPGYAEDAYPFRSEVATIRVVEIEPPHDREAVGVFVHRFLGQLVRVGIPQDRVDQRPVYTGLIHGGDRLLRRVWLLTMLRGRRTFFPEMNLAIDDQHLAYPSDPKIFSCPRIR